MPDLDTNKCPRWPPDVFCLCASILHASGAYSIVVNDASPLGDKKSKRKRRKEVLAVAEEWRKISTTESDLPDQLQIWWRSIFDEELALHQVKGKPNVVLALLNLLACADEACYGLGLYSPVWRADKASDEFEDEAEKTLFISAATSPYGATLCRGVEAAQARVLPKMHTPQNGLTIRSLSHHLAYTSAADIKPEWISAANDNKHHGMNFLVIPWPPRADPIQFRATAKDGVTDEIAEHAYGLFTFDMGSGPTVGYVRGLVDEATRKVGAVDGIILPELAMSIEEFNLLSEAFVTEDRFLISGVGKAAADGNCGSNEACLDLKVRLSWKKEELVTARTYQGKHHRWKLTKPQIIQYGISSNLHPCVDWWEHIEISARKISFVAFRPWLSLSLLICEDLARPDPVGDVLRAVGPNLIVALLSDAPQLIGRWPGRYAGAFADDPGSSVLTVTSLGMSELSKPSRGSQDRGRVVALWRDSKTGAQELELQHGSDALVLSISVEYETEWTADGRHDNQSSGYPTLTGVHNISVPKALGGTA